MNIKELKIKGKKYKLPIFLPDATLGITRGLDNKDLEQIGTRGVVVNTYHLNDAPGMDILQKYVRKEGDSGIKNFMNFDGLVVSDSGGWQVFSLIKRHGEGGEITDEGVRFNVGGEVNKKMGVFTPEDSIQIQFKIGADILICLDDFTGADDNEEKIKESVERTILWAQRTRKEFDKIIKEKKLTDETRPLLFAVIQGGWSKELRKYCAKELLKIGFDGYGYGGYMVNDKGELDEEMSKYIAELIPDEYPKFALGVGKPWDIARCYEFGWDIFDCVLPTRDGRHKRLYNFKEVSKAGLIKSSVAKRNGTLSPAFSEQEQSLKTPKNSRSSNFDPLYAGGEIDLKSPASYEFLYIGRGRFAEDMRPIGNDCDCFTCQNYSRGYLHHLFKIKDMLAYRLAVIHNLRTYNRLIDKLK
jgi:queuine tRNA-ribosyltransferase